MITIPTAELLGLIQDVAPFAYQHDDDPDINVLQIRWDGDMLHMAATDRSRAARSSWSPRDEPGADGRLLSGFGGADNPWGVLSPLPSVLELIRVYKLPEKKAHAPLQLDWNGSRLRVIRRKDTGHQAITTEVDTVLVEFPNLTAALDVEMMPEKIDSIAFEPAHVATFAGVRPRGSLRIDVHPDFCRVRVGPRFVATLRQQRTEEPAAAATNPLENLIDAVGDVDE